MWSATNAASRPGRASAGFSALGPGSHAADAIDGDVDDATWWRVVARRELDVGTEVDVGELLEQLRTAAGGDASRAVRDEVLVQPRRLDLGALHGHRDPRVALDVPHLLSGAEVGQHDLIAVEAHPHDGD